MRVPSSFVKGSGSLALVGSEPASGRAGTAQSAPSSSTPAAAMAAAAGGMTVTAPATASATANATARERPELLITRDSFR